jgi:hypothetical protein
LLTGGNLTNILATRDKLFENIVIDKALEAKFLNSFIEFMLSVKENPTAAEAAVIQEKIEQVNRDFFASVTSVPGLENSLNDSVLMAKPENRDFYQAQQQLNYNLAATKLDPTYPYNRILSQRANAIYRFSHVVTALHEFRDRYRTGK